jgi:hypothetical protein
MINRCPLPPFGRKDHEVDVRSDQGRSLHSKAPRDCAVRIRSIAQRGAVSVEAGIWMASYLFAILGLVKAAYSEQPLLWLAVWPAPVALASTIFVFVRQGFHFRNGVLVLGRRRTFAALLPDKGVSRIGEKKTKMTVD